MQALIYIFVSGLHICFFNILLYKNCTYITIWFIKDPGMKPGRTLNTTKTFAHLIYIVRITSIKGPNAFIFMTSFLLAFTQSEELYGQ